jgi:hypothetical protein
MPGARRLFLVAGLILVVLAGGCKDDGTKPQETQYPTNPVPANGATNQPIHLNLTWQDGDTDLPAKSWGVCFGQYPNPPQVASGLASASYDPGTLAHGMTYYWQAVAYYDQGQTPGPVWTFTTVSAPGVPLD